jgi:hypothetical protein
MNNLTDFLVGLLLCHIFYFGLVYLKRHLNWKEIKSTIPATFYFDKDRLEFISFQVSSRGKNEEYFCEVRNGSIEEYKQETDVKQYTYRKPEEYTQSQKHCTRLDLSLAEFQDKEILKCKIKNLQLKYVLAIINYGIEDTKNRNKRFIRN